MKEIKLTQGKVTIVDDEDFEYLNQWKWYYSHGYAKRSGKEARGFLHRLVMQTPDNMQTDHINGDKLDNRKENLRYCTSSQNSANRGKAKCNKTGYKGVFREIRHFVKSSKIYYQAKIVLNRKPIRIGYYATPEEAAKAYDKKALELHGEFAKLNFPL